MIAPIVAFFATTVGRYSAILLMFAAAWFGFARHYENKGVSRVTAQIEKKVAEHAKTAEAARDSVKSIPADRLRDAYTRD